MAVGLREAEMTSIYQGEWQSCEGQEVTVHGYG